MFKKYFVFIIVLFLASCEKNPDVATASSNNEFTAIDNSLSRLASAFPEKFESGSKTSYTTGNVTLTSGSWNFNNAVIGTSTSDRKFDSKSVRIQKKGMLTMNFNAIGGATIVTIYHAKYGSDANSTWGLWYSTNSGSSWTKVGSTVTTSSTTLNSTVFQVNNLYNIRFQLRKLTGGKLNIDNFTIEQLDNAPSRDDNMAMGNPSNAVVDVNYPNNYLLVKTEFALSYNSSKGTANWVSWHLSTAWKGWVARCDCFTMDAQLPASFYRTSSSDYSYSGFDRGHMCPSADRDGSDADNAATFVMSNMIPQAPVNNQQTWVYLENYCRTLINAGNELYITSGGYGSGGSGSLGGITYTLANGKVNVPSHVWKVIVVLPVGTDDVNRVTSSTRIIAVKMPNTQTVNSQPWGYYRISVDSLESLTGYNFLSNVSTTIQSVIETTKDTGPTN